jgi:hypothetical protein
MFMDKHAGADMPTDMRRSLENDIRAKKKDAHGVVTKGVLVDHDAEEMTCITEAPDEASVREHHKDLGFSPTEVHRVDAIL